MAQGGNLPAADLIVILLGGNQMAGNFKTCGEAWRYCEKYGLNNISAGHSFQIAESLLRAYKDGAIQPAVEADVECSADFHKEEYLNGSTFCRVCGKRIR